MKIVFVAPFRSSWVKQDIQILKSEYSEVFDFVFNKNSSFQVFKGIVRALRYSDLVYIWFGSVLYFPIILLSKCLFKKVIIVSGGYDVAKTKDYHHGNFDKGHLSKLITKLNFFLCDRVLAVSEFNRQEVIKNTGISFKKVIQVDLGFRHAKNIIFPNKERIILMISSIEDKTRFYIKGGDRFAKLASSSEMFKFIHIGKINSEVKELFFKYGGKNIEFRGFLEFNSNKFNNLLRKSLCVAQLSRYESFGAAPIDGVRMGCIPILSDGGALLQLRSQYSIDYNEEDTKNFDNVILSYEKKVDINEMAEYYLDKFSFEKRAIKIHQTFKGML